MALSREDKIFLAYGSIRSKIEREELDRPHARALLYIAERFSISPLKADLIVKARQK